jgi:hypothetical protein
MRDDREIRRCACGRTFRKPRYCDVWVCSACGFLDPVAYEAANISDLQRAAREERERPGYPITRFVDDPGQDLSGEHMVTAHRDRDRADRS